MYRTYRFRLLAVSLLLSGCVKSITTNVEVFNKLPVSMAGKTYQISPEGQQNANLEWKTYFSYVKQILDDVGMKEGLTGSADYLVYMHYGVDGGRVMNYAYPVYGETGIQSSYTKSHITRDGDKIIYTDKTSYTPRYGIVGMGGSSSIQYTRWLKLEIAESEQSQKKNQVFIGRATSIGFEYSLPLVIPYMIRSLLDGFPQQRTVVHSVTLPMTEPLM